MFPSRSFEHKVKPYTVMLDPDGTLDFGLVIAVRAPTGILYQHQCGGHWTYQRQIEGFLVPLGSAPDAQRFKEAFAELFGGNPPPDGRSWSALATGRVEELVRSVRLWIPQRPPGERWSNLEFDRSHIEELTEAWIPAVTAAGAGVLLFQNSD